MVAKRAELERDGPTTWIKGYVSLQNKGREVDIQATWDTGCTQAIANMSVIRALGIQLEPLKRNMKIIDAGNKALTVLGTARLYIQAAQLGVARKSIEVAVIDGGPEKEILISLHYLKKWDMVHPSFPHQTISEFCNKDDDSEINSFYAYSALSPLINEKVPLPPPSEKCKDLKDKIISK